MQQAGDSAWVQNCSVYVPNHASNAAGLIPVHVARMMECVCHMLHADLQPLLCSC